MKSEIGKTFLAVMFLVVAAIVLFYAVTYLVSTHTRVDFLGIEVSRMDGIFRATSYRFDFSTGNEKVSRFRFPGTLLRIKRDRGDYFYSYTRLYFFHDDVDFEKAERIFQDTKRRFKPIIARKIMEFERQKKGKLLYYE